MSTLLTGLLLGQILAVLIISWFNLHRVMLETNLPPNQEGEKIANIFQLWCLCLKAWIILRPEIRTLISNQILPILKRWWCKCSLREAWWWVVISRIKTFHQRGRAKLGELTQLIRHFINLILQLELLNSSRYLGEPQPHNRLRGSPIKSWTKRLF